MLKQNLCTVRTDPVSSLKGRSPAKPGRVLMIDCETTVPERNDRRSTNDNVVIEVELNMFLGRSLQGSTKVLFVELSCISAWTTMAISQQISHVGNSNADVANELLFFI